MGKKKIRLTEKDLKRIVRKSIVNVLGCGIVNNNHVLREENVLRNDDLMEYAKLGKQYTGLNVDVFVDDGEAYKRNKHPLWIYVRNGYSNIDSFFPVVVSKTPFVPSHISKDDINIQEADLEAVMVFVSINALLLRDFADEKVEHMDFYKICKPVIYDIKKASGGISLDEMAILRPKVDMQQIVSEMTYNQKMSLNEMAQVNKRERGNNKFGFDSNVYYVYVRGEGGYKKFPHFHIKHRGEGWDIRMNMDGSFNSIKTKSDRRQKDEDFADVEKIAKVWVKQPNTLYPQMTNGQAAQFLWDSMN